MPVTAAQTGTGHVHLRGNESFYRLCRYLNVPFHVHTTTVLRFKTITVGFY